MPAARPLHLTYDSKRLIVFTLDLRKDAMVEKIKALDVWLGPWVVYLF